jgi:hypothetical protein
MRLIDELTAATSRGPRPPRRNSMSDSKDANAGSIMEGMRSQLEADQADGKLAGTSVERLEKAISHPKAQAVIQELMALEEQVVKQGDPAPDFTLPWLQGSTAKSSDRLTLSDHFGKRPVALIFGSYT